MPKCASGTIDCSESRPGGRSQDCIPSPVCRRCDHIRFASETASDALQKRRLASVRPYQTCPTVSTNPPAAKPLPVPSESRTPKPLEAASQPEEASPLPRSRKKKGGKKTKDKRSTNDIKSTASPTGRSKAGEENGVSNRVRDASRRWETEDEAVRRGDGRGTTRNLREVTVGQVSDAVGSSGALVAGSDALLRESPEAAAPDRFGGGKLAMQSGIPCSPSLPGVLDGSGIEEERLERLKGSSSGALQMEDFAGTSRIQGSREDAKGSSRSEAGRLGEARESEGRDASKRRQVVDCLSAEEAQLLRALVLEAGRNGRGTGPEHTGISGIDHSARKEGSEPGVGGSRGHSEGKARNGNKTVEPPCREGEMKGDAETDVVAGVFAASGPGTVQKVLLAMAVSCTCPTIRGEF